MITTQIWPTNFKNQPPSPPPLYCVILSWSVGQLDTEGVGTSPVGTFRKWKYFVDNKLISTTAFQPFFSSFSINSYQCILFIVWFNTIYFSKQKSIKYQLQWGVTNWDHWKIYLSMDAVNRIVSRVQCASSSDRGEFCIACRIQLSVQFHFAM